MSRFFDFSVKFSSQEVENALVSVQNKLTNARPLMMEIGKIYLESTKRRFDSKSNPQGRQWKHNTVATKRLKDYGLVSNRKWIRRPAIEGPHSIGVWTGKLRTSVGLDIQGNEVLIGVFKNSSANEYAKTFHFGAKKGEFGGAFNWMSGRFQPIPWGDIPPRPFLGATKKANDKVLTVIKNYLDLNK